MTRGSVAPAVAGRIQREAVPGTVAAALAEQSEHESMSCAHAARMRGEPLAASAVRFSRFLLLEVPGPWGNSALDGKHIEGAAARQLAKTAAAAGAHVMLIRRPGRHPAAGRAEQRSMAWALADAAPGTERVLWGSWREPADLLELDLAAEISPTAQAVGPQRLALVCTNGKRDQCCAIHGRPVAQAIAATGWDTWECSHLGGHRFAATILLLPTGDMFGWLDPRSAVEVVRQFDAGQLVLSHYRGRAGTPEPVQAALHAAAVRLGDFRRDAVQVSSASPVPAPSAAGWPAHLAAAEVDMWQVEITHEPEHGPAVDYRMMLIGDQLAPAFLSCHDNSPKAEIRYTALSFSRRQ